ncbi:FxLYD domain-containing protein [Streptomyces sp. NPDC002574]|uniref:FxLYD domain-containing protein n=1 Tax=Streptomyces sp. NPDC002574 TaxID=3364652 RepID=UPI0036A2FAD9
MTQSSHTQPPGSHPSQEPGWVQPPKKSGAGKILGFGVVAILVVIGGSVAFALRTGDGSSPGDKAPAVSTAPTHAAVVEEQFKDDVKVASCGLADFTKWPSAEVTITNHGDRSADYQVRVAFTDETGTRIAQGVATTTGLAAGASVKETAQGSAAAAGEITCKVTEVGRTAAN